MLCTQIKVGIILILLSFNSKGWLYTKNLMGVRVCRQKFIDEEHIYWQSRTIFIMSQNGIMTIERNQFHKIMAPLLCKINPIPTYIVPHLLMDSLPRFRIADVKFIFQCSKILPFFLLYLLIGIRSRFYTPFSFSS